MTKIFSTKLDAKLLVRLEEFCKKYHLKKSHVLEEMIEEGIRRRGEAMELARSFQRGLEQEERGEFYSADEVEKTIFNKRKAA